MAKILPFGKADDFNRTLDAEIVAQEAAADEARLLEKIQEDLRQDRDAWKEEPPAVIPNKVAFIDRLLGKI